MYSCVYTNVIRDSLIVGNDCVTSGGGIYCADSNIIISNCTVADNWANAGGGMYLRSGPYTMTVTVTHSIVWGNDAYSGPAFVLDDGGLNLPGMTFTADYSDMQTGHAVYSGNWTLNIAGSLLIRRPAVRGRNWR